MRIRIALAGIGVAAAALGAPALGAAAPAATARTPLAPVPAAELLRPAAEPGATHAARGGLVRFASCEALRDDLRERAARAVGPYGLPGMTGGPLAYTGVPSAAEDSAASAAPGAAPAMSGTNVQEAGVDEPDIVKTDGRVMYVLTATVLRALDLTGAAPVVLGELDLTRFGAESMFLVDGRPIVIGQVWEDEPLPARAADATATAGSPVAADMAADIGPVMAQRTTVTEIDASDPARMRVRTVVRADGRQVAARYADGTVRLVVSSTAHLAGMVMPAAPGPAAEWVADLTNRRAVAESEVTDWLPRVSVHHAGAPGVTEEPAVACNDVSRPARGSGLGMATVLTLDVHDRLTLVDSDAIVTDADVVYASAGSLYVATPDQGTDGSAAPERGVTLVHRFDTSTPGRTEHRASGKVRGYPLNQFSMSEHGGHLRIATTDEPDPWDAAAGESESFVTVLAERDGRLVQRGRVGGLGRGERIHSVRFMGDRGYVVTFRQTDPLYSLDLADPERPRVTGELKITGYSAYLHPVDDTTLIGVGQEADTRGRTRGAQVSLFDVSDPAHPRRIAQRQLGPGWSEAEYDHHAVLYWPGTGLLALPLEVWRPGGADFTGAVGLRVTRQGGITLLGRIIHGPDTGPVRRSVVVGDALYTVSDSGVKRSTLDGLDDRGWAAFD